MKKTINLVLVIVATLALSGIISCTTVVSKPYNLYETTNFKIFCTDEEESVLNDLEEALEKNYDRIISDFQINPPMKFNLYIYPDISTYHNAIGRPSAPETSVGTVKGVDIYFNAGRVHPWL